MHTRSLAAAAVLIAAGSSATAQIQFKDSTVRAGFNHYLHMDAESVPPLFPRQNTRYGPGCAVIDFDNDGDQDVYITNSYGNRSMFYMNMGNGRFFNVSRAVGTENFGWGRTPLAVDLDNDGFEDLVVLNDCSLQDDKFPHCRLYRNNGDRTFTDVAKGSGFDPVEATFGGISAADYDKDGDLDLIVVGWYEYTCHLYRNDGKFMFTDVTLPAGVKPKADEERSHWTPLFADFNSDGWPDIYMAVDFDEDLMFRNNGDGTFSDVSAETGVVHNFNDMGVAPADFDEDGDLDMLTTNMSMLEMGQGMGDNCLYVNDGKGNFQDLAVQYKVDNTGFSWGTTWFDADLDGARDLIAVSGWEQPEMQTPAFLFHNDGSGGFTDIAAAAGIDHVGDTRCLNPLDFDQDGDTDFLVFDVMGGATLYENTTPRDGNRWLAVRAVGTTSNRDGIGARVYVTYSGKTRFDEIVAGGSFYASPAHEARFGLGQAEDAAVKVVFPSGKSVELDSVKLDRVLTVTEPQ